MTVVAVSGAGGRLGRAVADALTQLVDPQDVVLLTRRPDALAATAGDAQVRFADFDDPASLDAALEGVDRLLVISTDAIGGRVKQHTDAFAAAARAGVGHVVYTSMLKPTEDHPSVALAADHRASEQALRDSGVAWTILRDGFYAEILVGMSERAIGSGELVSNADDGRAAWVAISDVADVAAHILANGGHEAAALDVVGPEGLTYAEIVATVRDLSGKPVEVIDISDEAYHDGMLANGVGEADAEEYTSFGQAIRGGYAYGDATTVADICGRPARTVRDVLASNGIGADR